MVRLCSEGLMVTGDTPRTNPSREVGAISENAKGLDREAEVGGPVDVEVVSEVWEGVGDVGGGMWESRVRVRRVRVRR
jgi:hypothetical protein